MRLDDRPNFVLILTDQQRATQHFPPDWEERNLPTMTRLKRSGLSFDNAFCNACMCSPSRSTLLSGLYPAQHKVIATLTSGGTFSPTEATLDPTLSNLALMLRGAGYQVHYRGKWHLSKGSFSSSPLHSDVAIYGFEGWVPPRLRRGHRPRTLRRRVREPRRSLPPAGGRLPPRRRRRDPVLPRPLAGQPARRALVAQRLHLRLHRRGPSGRHRPAADRGRGPGEEP